MLFILEGPDGAGKTTYLGKLLAAFPQAVNYHFSAPKPGEDQLDIYSNILFSYPKEQLIIFDRSWYSDLVYGPIMRQESTLPISYSRALEAIVLQQGGGCVFYLTAPIRTLWARCQKRGETYIKDIETLDAIANEYEKVMQKHVNLPMFKMNTGR